MLPEYLRRPRLATRLTVATIALLVPIYVILLLGYAAGVREQRAAEVSDSVIVGQMAGAVVDVATIDDLARLAERNGRMILHEIEQGASRYVVQDDGVAYCYRATVPGRPAEEHTR